MMSTSFDTDIGELRIARARREIVFIENNVADFDTLVQGIGKDKQVVILDATQDGLQQIAQALAGQSGIDALHIITHGSAGALNLGALTLNADSLEANASVLQAIGGSMSAGGDILLYGCDVAAGSGAGFVEQLAIATGADVAASNDATGAQALGGDWELEVTSGDVDTKAVVDMALAAQYQAVLNISSKTINFSNADYSAINGPSADLSYAIPGYTGYTLKVDGESVGIGNYGGSYLLLSDGSAETKVTFSFGNGKVFSPTSIKLNETTSPTQQVIITGRNANGDVVASTSATLNQRTDPAHYRDYDTIPLAGFNNIASLEITPGAGPTMKYFEMTDLVLTNVTTSDTIPPVAPGKPDLDPGFDSGKSSTDNNTNATALTFFGVPGSVEANATLDLYDGAAKVGTTTVAADGHWTVANVSLAAEGIHTITAKATDAAGNVSAASVALSVTIDRTPPAVAGQPDLAAASDSGVDTDNRTNATAMTFSGAAGSVEGNATVDLYDGATKIGTITAAANGSWTINNVALAAEGVHTITATATDAAGNTSAASTALSVTVDRTAPATTVASAVFSADTGTSATDLITKTAGQAISGLLSANLAVGEHVEVSLDNGGSWSTATAGAGGNTWSIAATLAASNTLQVRVVDTAGNAGAAYTHAYVLDQSPPSAPSAPDLETASDSGSSHTDDITGNKLPTFSGSADAGSTVTLYDGAAAIGAVTAGGDGSWHITSNTELGQGSHSITAKATDLAGNVSLTSTALDVFIETRTPATSIASLAFSADTGTSATDLITKTAAQTIAGTLSANLVSGERVEVSFDNGSSWTNATASVGSSTWSLPATLAAGTHTLQVRVTNSVDNSGPVHSQDYTLDSGAPGLTITSDVSQLTAGGTAAITFTFSEDPGATFSWSGSAGDVTVSGGALSAIWGTGPVRHAVFTPNADTNGGTASITVADGSYIDKAGNDGTAGTSPSLSFDTLAPGAPSTPDLAAASDSGSSSTDDITGVTTPTFSGTAEVGATVRLYDGATEIGSIVATDGTWAIASNRTLAAGSHAITATATDSAGNTGAASAVRTVQILTSGPATTIAGLHFSADSGASDHDLVTAIASQTVSGTLSASLATGERVQVSLDGGGNWTTANASAGSNAWSLPAALASGTHTLQVRVIDALGNTGPVLSQDYTLDQGAPGVAITSDVSQLKIGQTAAISFTFSEDPGASFSQADITVSGGTLSAIAGTGTVRTAVFTPDADANGGTASITVAAGAYADKAGNDGTAGAGPSLVFDTLAPGAPSAPDLDAAKDKGTSNTDDLTNETTLIFKGSAEAGATVILYDTDGTTEIGRDSTGSGTWTIATSALAAGAHTVTARAVDAAGNAGAASAPATVTIDTAAPTLEIVRGASQLKAGETATVTFLFSEDPGTSFGLDDITVTNGSVSGLSGTGLTRTVSFTPASGVDGGVATIAAEGYTDAAGNAGAKGAAVSIGVDTVAPPAPGAPVLKAASDSGILGDGITEFANVVIEGTALANALVTLYDGAATQGIGSVRADAAGKWSIALANLGLGAHALSTTQSDAAGNVSARGAVFDLRIDRPTPLVDGMPVQTQPILVPGGALGTAVSVPVVTSDRAESAGKAGVADIPLLSSGGSDLLVAQLAPGYGLSASGANVPAANAAAHLIGAILAATPGHAAGDQGHLTANGQSFLDGLAASSSLLVETVAPVSSAAPVGVLTLNGSAAPAGQSVALVIESAGLAPGSTIALQDVDFAAVIGAAKVVAGSAMIVTGDAASQQFTVAAGASVYAGAGNDTLSAAAPAGPAAPGGMTLLQGGQDSDVAAFSGARSDFNLEFHNGYVVVASKAEPAVQTLVLNVEQLQFGDGAVAVQNGAGLTTVAGLYQTMLGRQADVYGFEFWADAHQAGVSWGRIVLDMLGSPESQGRGAILNGNATDDVTLLYQALFNRAPDAEGLAFWTGAMRHGATLESVADEMVQSVEMVGHQRAALDWNFYFWA
jgi:hypothetical protein